MRIVLTRHAKRKFSHPSIVKLAIKRSHLLKVIASPDRIWQGPEQQVKLLIGRFNAGYDIRVAYKEIDDIMIVITFHPAKRGRYQ